MTKLEAWKAWHESLGIGMEATEHALEKGSHGKAFSYAWDAAVKAEREACAKVAESYEPICDTCPSGVTNAIRARREG